MWSDFTDEPVETPLTPAVVVDDDEVLGEDVLYVDEKIRLKRVSMPADMLHRFVRLHERLRDIFIPSDFHSALDLWDEVIEPILMRSDADQLLYVIEDALSMDLTAPFKFTKPDSVKFPGGYLDFIKWRAVEMARLVLENSTPQPRLVNYLWMHMPNSKIIQALSDISSDERLEVIMMSMMVEFPDAPPITRVAEDIVLGRSLLPRLSEDVTVWLEDQLTVDHARE